MLMDFDFNGRKKSPTNERFIYYHLFQINKGLLGCFIFEGRGQFYSVKLNNVKDSKAIVFVQSNNFVLYCYFIWIWITFGN